jgi:hypothetical protein
MGQCGTPACVSQGVGISLSTETLNFLLEGNELLISIMLVEYCKLDNLYNKAGCHVVSKDFSTSKNITAIDVTCFIEKATELS